ncbi:hypothetical protein [Streptomyces sp. RFCAC02]|uniref:hypothetical protein n=1 Tax=Streptomyces sp. RFCAC02 TaxID=2499143 RepID=UPI001021E86C|nr:hypothetical protein [Streptomyces sp. RFCAC02]
MRPVVCGREVRLPMYLAIALGAGSRIVRCALADHPPGRQHAGYAAEWPASPDQAVWVIWSELDLDLRWEPLRDCPPRPGAGEECCVLYEGHPPPCSWAMFDPQHAVDSFLASLPPTT